MIVPKHTPSHSRAPWRVYHKGRSFWYADQADAQKKCDELNDPKNAGAIKLTAREVDEYLYCRQLLGGTPLLHAVRSFIERNPVGDRTLTVGAEIDDHLLGYAKSRPIYLEKKTYLLEKLRTAAGGKLLADVSSTMVKSILAAEKSDWVRNDLLTHMRVLFRAAVKEKKIFDDPCAMFEDKTTTPTKVILTLEDTEYVLETCRSQFPEILSGVALQLFAGIRTSEITRLDWSAVKHGKLIDIDTKVAKTHERRVIDWWAPALTKWMPVAQESGPVVDHPDNFEHKKWLLIAVCRKAKPDFKFGQNAFRHSFCTYVCAFFENAGKGALLAGQHDVHIFFKNYRDYRTKELAEIYFGVKKP